MDSGVTLRCDTWTQVKHVDSGETCVYSVQQGILLSVVFMHFQLGAVACCPAVCSLLSKPIDRNPLQVNDT